ncbi:MAG: hypothetical protein MZU95_09140 [Desulfomicrobium escambiense]|nr:hypothetical protein [Desulfomicrobium escambiense]
MRTEFRLSGSGGQGLLLAGIVLAEAAILEGKNAVQTQSYGPEARGRLEQGGGGHLRRGHRLSQGHRPGLPAGLDRGRLPDLRQAHEARALSSSTRRSHPRTRRSRRGPLALPILETAAKDIGKKVRGQHRGPGVLAGISGIVAHGNLEVGRHAPGAQGHGGAQSDGPPERASTWPDRFRESRRRDGR